MIQSDHRRNLSADSQEQLACAIAAAVIDPAPVDAELAEMIGNLIIGNAAMAAASLNHDPVTASRDQAIAHPHQPGAILFGLSPYRRYSPQWVAWSNGMAICGQEPQDTHPGGTIPPVLAVAQHCGLTGTDLLRGVAAALEIQARLESGLAISAIAGIGAALRLDRRVIHRAARQALSQWPDVLLQRHAPATAFAGKMAVETVDWVQRSAGEPSLMEGQFTTGLLGRGELRHTLLENGPSTRNDCIGKFRTLADGVISRPEQDRFLKVIDRLADLKAEELGSLGFTVDPDIVQRGRYGLFDRRR